MRTQKYITFIKCASSTKSSRGLCYKNKNITIYNNKGERFFNNLSLRKHKFNIPHSPYFLMLSASSSSFFKQSSQIGIGTKIVNKDSIRIAIELGPPMSESSSKISKFYVPTDSEHKLNKTRIENWPPIEFKLGFPWLRIRRYNHRLPL